MKFYITIDDATDKIGWQPHETALKLFELAAPFWGDQGLSVTVDDDADVTYVTCWSCVSGLGCTLHDSVHA